MKRKAVLAHLYLAGKSPGGIARELDVSPQMVSKVIHGKGWSRKIALCIARHTGKPISVLWPGRSESSCTNRKAA